METTLGQHTSSTCDEITIKQEPVEVEPHASPNRVIEFVPVKEETPVEAEAKVAPKQEIEFVSVKEETSCLQKWEEPDGNESTQDPLSIAEGECPPSEDLPGPSTFNIDKTENEEDEEDAVSEDDGQDFKPELESTSSGSEPESTIPVGVEDGSGTSDSGRLVTKQQESCANKSGAKRRAYRCTVCKKTFTQFQDLKKHVHVDSRKCEHSCSVCHKTFTLSINLKAHIRVHTGERPYSCDVCNRTFRQSSALSKHCAIHLDERPYVCGICHRRYTSRSTLKEHLRVHNDYRPYTCGVCRKSFSTQRLLARHLGVHTVVRPFSCDVCKEAFIHFSSLMYHARMKVCHKKFTSGSNVKKQ